jgi:cytoskeletal protein RodZ
MFEKFHSKSLTTSLAAVIAALGVGGVAMAQNSASTPTTKSPAPAVQSTQPSSTTAAPDTPESPSDKADTGTAGSSDTPTPGDQADSSTESASETVNGDGPGGHADEPGNPNADHQFQGQE